MVYHPITVQSISPGYVKTAIGEKMDSEVRQKALSAIGNPEGLQTEDVADAVIYALSTPAHVQIRELMICPLGQNYWNGFCY